MIYYPGLLGHYNDTDTLDAESLNFEDEGIMIYKTVINCVVMYFTLTCMVWYFNLNSVW